MSHGFGEDPRSPTSARRLACGMALRTEAACAGDPVSCSFGTIVAGWSDCDECGGEMGLP